MGLQILLCILGFLLLWFAADWLVKGAGSLARDLGIRPVVIGLTVVAFGTSAPELVVSLVSGIRGKPMLALGNVLGSNICNLALILGLCALFRPIRTDRSVVRREIPILIAISLALLAFCLDDRISRSEGGLLFAGIVLYTLYHYLASRRERAAAAEFAEEAETKIGHVSSRGMQLLLVVAGIGGVVGGAQLVVNAAERIMLAIGVSEKFIGLTLVAFGTSLPELATSVVAAIRKEMDISLGNLVGSNVFNILCVLGLTAIVRPVSIGGGFFAGGLTIDFGVMLLVSALPILLIGRSLVLGRRGGALLLAIYAGYLVWLVASR